MQGSFTLRRVLIVVKTYPNPSESYKETVCTAGITETGEWVRLYPIDFRYRPSHQQFKKYQWIEVELEDVGHHGDKRLESRRPNLDTIKMLGDPLSTTNGWYERRRIIEKLPVRTVNECRELYAKDYTSLAVVKPTEIADLIIEEDTEDWSPKQKDNLRQFNLFGGKPKELRKIPYKFSYKFRCNDTKNFHKTMITDWELGELFLKQSKRYGDEEAAKRVRDRFLNELCHKDKDTHFFMGTTYPHNSWIVLGVFWPPRRYQPKLF